MIPARMSETADLKWATIQRRSLRAVDAEVVHDFGDVRRVEGLVVHEDGSAHYVLDEEGHVALRTLLTT